METKRAAGPGNGQEPAVDDTADQQRQAIVAVMERLAGGEQTAMWDLHVLAERPVAKIVRGEARRIDFWLSEDDVLDLTLDAATELGKLAHGWDPDGAPPWVWARKRIIGLVHDHIGVFADPLDETHLDLVAAEAVEQVDDVRSVLRSLAQHHPAARQLELLLDEHVSERDAAIWLEVQMEKVIGNRSPAVTVAAVHGMRPDAVRKVVQRVGGRLVERVVDGVADEVLDEMGEVA